MTFTAKRFRAATFLVTTAHSASRSRSASLPDAAAATAEFAPNAWVTIGEDGIVTIVPPAVEMGQGVRTSLPLILAEDLDADWSKVRIGATPDDAQLYGNPIFQNQLTTVGSLAVTGYYEKLRLAGAQARAVLLANAADGLEGAGRANCPPSPAWWCMPSRVAGSATAISPRPQRCPIRCRR